MKLLDKNPLFGVFLIPVIIDVLGTVAGQPKGYWTSGYKVFNEAVPIYPLLQIHPLLFVATALVLLLPIYYFLTMKLKSPLNLWATMAIFAGHSYNSVSWLRTVQHNMGFFAGNDQLNQALGLIPMTIYVIFIGYIASKFLMIYLQRLSPKL